GTPLFMSPEQIVSTRNVDGRADIWSIGVILYSFVTGQFPFVGSSNFEIFEEVHHKHPASPSTLRPDIPPAFSAIALRCLEKAPDRRFPQVADLAQALKPFAGETAPLSFPSQALAPTVNDPGASADRQASQVTRTIPGGPTPVARIVIGGSSTAQTG